MSIQSTSVIKTLVAAAISTTVLLATGTAHAKDHRRGHNDRYGNYGHVIDVRPVYQNTRVREPRRECWIETEQRVVGYETIFREPQDYRSSGNRESRIDNHRSRRTSNRAQSAGGTIVGSVIGGVIGNQLGRGSSSSTRTGATIAGAIIGGVVANETSGSSNRSTRVTSTSRRGSPIYETVEVERCRQVSGSRIQKKLQHFDVTYRFRGRIYNTRTQRNPGRRIEVRESSRPARR